MKPFSTLAFVTLFSALSACSEQGELPAAADVARDTAPLRVPTSVDLQFLAHTDAAKLELPHSAALRDGKAFVVFNPTGAVVTVDAKGVVTPYGNVPLPAPFAASTNAITFGPDGSAFVSVGAFSPDVTSGIYKIPAGGGTATLWASSADMPFPNGLAWLGDRLLVADSKRGAVLAIDCGGRASTWASDPLLVGTPSCPGANPHYVFGASGIAANKEEVVVTNPDSALVVRIPIRHGEAGPARPLAGPDCARLAGVDQATAFGRAYLVASNRLARILSVTREGDVSTIAEGSNLDFPSSIAFGRLGDTRGFVVTNFAVVPTGSPPAGAGLLFAPLERPSGH